MASKQLVLLLAAVVVTFLPALAAATEHTVGDDKGWALGFNYTAWAETKRFEVGDTLLFKYSEPSHTVVEVSGADFAACSTPAAAKVMATGRDRVAIDGAGRRWFVCGIGAYCLNGMKVRIDVVVPGADAHHTRGRSLIRRPKIYVPVSPAVKVQARLVQAVLAAVAIALLL